MKIGKYISIVTSSLIIFIFGWIMVGAVFGNEYSTWKGVVGSIILIIFIFYFVSVSINMLKTSIKRLLMFKNDKGLWKILTLSFGIGMVVLSGLVVIFALVWTIFALKDGIANTSLGLERSFDTWAFNNFIASKSFIAGNSLAQMATSSAPFGLFVTSFVFILLWTGAGITYEVLKKTLGGNPKYNQDMSEKNGTNDNNVSGN